MRLLLVFVSIVLGRLSGGANPLCETWSQQETGAAMLFRGQGKGLAIAAILMGMMAPAIAGDALYASLGDTTRSPIGWVEFCADNPGDCRGGASQPRDIVMSQTAWRDLLRGNRRGNETIQPMTDMDHWGVIEKW